MEKIFHIAYVCDKNYVFQCAVSLRSLLLNGRRDAFFHIHVMTDGSLEDEDNNLFRRLKEEFNNCVIEEFSVQNSVMDELDYSGAVLNKMTMHRLLLPEVLPDVDILLYLDCDTLIVGDITNVFNHSMDEFLVAGVKDKALIEETNYSPEGLKNRKDYINAGVLLMNLKKIRKDGVQNAFLDCAKKNYRHMDQDVINVVCQDKILFLDFIYNVFSFYNEKDKIIIHYAGGSEYRPWLYLYTKYSDEWWGYSNLFKNDKHHTEQRKMAEKFTSKRRQYDLVKTAKEYEKVYVFGGGFYGEQLVRAFIANGVCIQAILDNNIENDGKSLCGTVIRFPEKVDFDKNSIVYISNQNETNRRNIKHQLIKMGLDDKNIVNYYPLTPSRLRGVDQKYMQGVMDDYFKFQFGL